MENLGLNHLHECQLGILPELKLNISSWYRVQIRFTIIDSENAFIALTWDKTAGDEPVKQQRPNFSFSTHTYNMDVYSSTQTLKVVRFLRLLANCLDRIAEWPDSEFPKKISSANYRSFAV